MHEIQSEQTIQPGTEITTVGTAGDAPTIFCDGMRGVAYSGNVVKVNLLEQFTDPASPGKVFGKHVLNLVIPVDQFAAIVAILKQVVDDNILSPAKVDE
jgi:hypothetical protein